MQKCLMIGSGHKIPQRRLRGPSSAPEEETQWVTLDINPNCNPDVVFDLDSIEKGAKLPFEDNTFDEIHAYEVMEHYGHQGDLVGFFTGWRELWRILKTGGYVIGTSPGSDCQWTWGDPGHRRVIAHTTLTYLSRTHYRQLGHSASSDYREFVEPCWWDIGFADTTHDHFAFALRKVEGVPDDLAI